MKVLFTISILCVILGFKPSDPKIFHSNNNKITLEADDTWSEMANMKGVEVFIFKKNTKDNSTISIVISKDEGLLPLTGLEQYSAKKIFLQTSVLGTVPNLAVLKKINDVPMKMYEYDYSDKELSQRYSIVYHAVIGGNGYQIVFTGHPDIFKLNRPAYNQIINSIKIK
jgi:hypothetical protein